MDLGLLQGTITRDEIGPIIDTLPVRPVIASIHLRASVSYLYAVGGYVEQLTRKKYKKYI